MKASKWIQRVVKIPAAYSARERRAIASDILDYIRERTADGKGKDGKSWSGAAGKYSKSYKQSLQYQIAGKGNKVDLKLTGDMLETMRLIEDDKGAIKIGFDEGDAEAGKAEGNIRGSYGQPTGNKSKARDFLALSREEIKKILQNYPLDDKEALKENVSLREAADAAAEDIAKNVTGADLANAEEE